MTTQIKIAQKGPEPLSIPAHLSKSGRWAAHRKQSGYTKGWDVSHVATGVSGCVDAGTLREARTYLEAFDGIPTPGLDALPFGKISAENGAAVKPELLALWEARKNVREKAR